MDRDASTRARIAEHWKASERGDTDTEHAIYADRRDPRLPAVRRALPGPVKDPGSTRRAPGRAPLHRPADPGRRRPVGKRVRDYLRRRAHLLGERHGVHRRPGHPRDPVLRRPLPGALLAGGASRSASRTVTDESMRRPGRRAVAPVIRHDHPAASCARPLRSGQASREPEKIVRKNRKTFRMSRKIDAARIGAEARSALVRSRWKSNMVNPAKMSRPSTE